MKTRNENSLPLMITFFLVALLIGFRIVFMKYIVKPISIGAWLLWRIMESLDQSIYWATLIIICAIFTVRLMLYKEEKKPNLVYDYSYKPPNRVSYWKMLIDDALVGEYESEPLRKILKEVVISTISQVERLDNKDAEELIEKEISSIPPAVRTYLFPSKNEQKLGKMLFPVRWFWWRKRKYIQEQKLFLEKTINWLETELEIDNGK